MKKTVFLMVLLMMIFMWVGNETGGAEGMKTAFWTACGVNLFSYFFSDKLVLKQYKAQVVNKNNAPELYDIVKRLAERANLPMPKIYIIPEQLPNAFATGRNPKHAAVAATRGLLELMTPQEIEGVLAHEMSHVKHYDILIGSVAAAFAGAVAMLANSTQRRNHNSGNRTGVVSAILVPIAATIIQMAISRTREYKADEGSAYLTEHPEWLISALSKLEEYAQSYQMQRASKQTAHLFIINPFCGLKGGLSGLFSTHPQTADRIARLERLKRQFK